MIVQDRLNTLIPPEERIQTPPVQDHAVSNLANEVLKIIGLFFCALGGSLIAAGSIAPAIACIVAGVVLLIFQAFIGSDPKVVPVSPTTSDMTLPIENNLRIKSSAEIRAEKYLSGTPSRTNMVHFSFMKSHCGDSYQNLLGQMKDPSSVMWTPQNVRAAGIMLGMACGDAQGAPFEFMPYQNQLYLSNQKLNQFHLMEGQWTDDTSMGLCLADTIIATTSTTQKSIFTLNETQLMWAFTDWWRYGYNNAFTVGEAKGSVGLGGNIDLAFRSFHASRDAAGPYATPAGDQATSGNGSLMRLGPIAIIARNEEEASQLAKSQSFVTHQGLEAADCCAVMACILHWALHDTHADGNDVRNSVFEKLGRLPIPGITQESVKALIRGGSAINPNTQNLENWFWKSPHFTFSPYRVRAKPTYVGSYAMDALAMALHCVYTTNTFEDAVNKAARRGGDADTVAAITGQIAGAIYGLWAIPKAWRDQVQQWDRGGEIALRGYWLDFLRAFAPPIDI